MRQLTLAVVVLLLGTLLLPAGVGDEGRSPAPLQPGTRDGDPLHLAPPEAWLPVLMETQGDFAQAAEVAAATMRISYNLYPLGDVNGDRREDFLLVNRTEEEREDDFLLEYEVTAVSGADHAALWRLEVPDGSYWYPVGEVDGDGVKDLVVRTQTVHNDATTQGQQGVTVSRSESSYKVSFQFVSGRTGAALFVLPCESKLAYTTARASSPVSSAQLRDFTWTECFPASITDGAGVDLITDTITDYRGPFLNAFVASVSARSTTDTVRVQRFDATGAQAWEWKIQKDQAYAYWDSVEDLTGDGIGDGVYSVYSIPTAYASTPVGQADAPTPVAGELGLVDGKTGKTAWSIATDSGSRFTSVSTGASLRAAGESDILFAEFHQPEGPAGAWQTTLRQINGATGAALSTRVMKDRIASVNPHADLDGDGRDELWMVQSKVVADPLEGPIIDDVVEFSVVKADYSVVWGPQKFGEADHLLDWMEDTDLNGDGVDEFLVAHDEDWSDDAVAFRFYNGANGALLWDYQLTSAVVGFEPLGDVDGVPGDDIAITLFDLPAQLLSPAKGDGKATEAPGEAGAPPEINYANHRGRLEIRRGTDRELIWEKTVHDPKEVGNVSANHVYAYGRLIPDTNEDGTPEVLYNFETPQYYATESEGLFTVEKQEGGLLFALLISGADGATLISYPESKAATGAVIGQAGRPNAVSDAPAQKEGVGIPALGPLLAALVLAGVVLARRRHA